MTRLPWTLHWCIAFNFAAFIYGSKFTLRLDRGTFTYYILSAAFALSTIVLLALLSRDQTQNTSYFFIASVLTALSLALFISTRAGKKTSIKVSADQKKTQAIPKNKRLTFGVGTLTPKSVA